MLKFPHHKKEIKLWKAYWLIYILGIPAAVLMGYVFIAVYYMLNEYSNLISYSERTGVKLLMTGPILWFTFGWYPLWFFSVLHDKNNNLLIAARLSSLVINFWLLLFFTIFTSALLR